MGLLKFINLDYKDDVLVKEAIILISICLLESIRVHLGRKGSLSDNGEWKLRNGEIMYRKQYTKVFKRGCLRFFF